MSAKIENLKNRLARATEARKKLKNGDQHFQSAREIKISAQLAVARQKI